jgi:hypothetical protein
MLSRSIRRVCRTIALALIVGIIFCSGPGAGAADQTPLKPFRDAIAQERRPAALALPVTGISVPHHILAADLIARGLQAAAGNHYDRIPA